MSVVTPNNTFLTQAIIDKWPSHEFRNRPRQSRHGFVYQEALHRVLNQSFFYVYGADSFVCIDSIKVGAPELIFDKNAKRNI